MGDDRGWSPYLAGALSGLLIVLSVMVSGNFFGASTSFLRTAGIFENIFSPGRVSQMEAFSDVVPVIDWQWMFVVGILVGAFISSITSGSFLFKAIPPMWEGRFGPSKVKRGLVAFAGGFIGLFGARIAGG